MRIHTLPMNKNKPCDGDDDQTTDLITYDSSGDIISWSIFSWLANDWINVDLVDLQKKWPSKIQFVQNEINFRLHDMRMNQPVDEYVKAQKEGA